MASVASATARTTGSGGTTTSGSFTPANGSLLVACVGSDSANTTSVTFTVSGGSLTWTEQRHCDTLNFAARSGAAAIWTAPVSTGASMTVTAAGGPDTISLQTYVVTGQNASPIGTGNVGSTTTAANTASVFTSTGANSVLFFSANDWAQTGVATSSDMTITTYNVATFVSGFSGFKTLGSIAAQTAQFTWPSAPDCVWAALEVLDAGTVYVPKRVLILSGGAAIQASVW